MVVIFLLFMVALSCVSYTDNNLPAALSVILFIWLIDVSNTILYDRHTEKLNKLQTTIEQLKEELKNDKQP